LGGEFAIFGTDGTPAMLKDYGYIPPNGITASASFAITTPAQTYTAFRVYTTQNVNSIIIDGAKVSNFTDMPVPLVEFVLTGSSSISSIDFFTKFLPHAATLK